MSDSYNPSDYLVDISDIHLPIKLSELFNNYNENVLELGFGEGEFLIDIANRYQNTNFIGIEIKRSRFLKALRHAAKFKTKNIKFIHMDASLAVKQLFEYPSFTNIHINFPDPWPKSKHHKHRLFNVDLLLNLNKILFAKGQLYIASDHEDYIMSMKQAFKQIKEFKLAALLKKAVGSTNLSLSRTRFEQEFIDQGKDIFYLNYIKI